MLRSLVSMVGKGMAREYFFAAAHAEGYNLISDSVHRTRSMRIPSAYPGDQLGGETMDALRRCSPASRAPAPPARPASSNFARSPRQATTPSSAGDGTAAHPDLYDRDLLAVFPFQSSPDALRRSRST